MELNDHKAVRAVLQGDVEAYRILVLRHSAALFRVGFRITGNEADADEVVQEAFLRGYQRLPSFRFDSAFGSWIYRIAMRCAFDLVERRDRQPIGSEDAKERMENAAERVADTAASPERLLLNREMADRRAFAMRALTPLERAAFLLRHVEEQSTSEIAKALEMEPNAVKQAVFRAVQKLRQRLAAFQGEAGA